LRVGHGVNSSVCVVGGDFDLPGGQDRSESRRLRYFARTEGVVDHVDFVGQRVRSQLRLYYCASDVFVSTPWYEPFGMTPVEAMACATPVIGSDTGGIRYSVRDGETDFLVPPRDPDPLAVRLSVLARYPS